MRWFTNKILPDEALVIPIRENHSVAILNLPYDLSNKEFEKINRIITALIEQPKNKSEGVK